MSAWLDNDASLGIAARAAETVSEVASFSVAEAIDELLKLPAVAAVQTPPDGYGPSVLRWTESWPRADALGQDIALQLSRRPDRHFGFDEGAERVVQQLVDASLSIDEDEDAQLYLQELIRVMLGLQQAAPKAGQALRRMITESAGVMERLRELQDVPQLRTYAFTAAPAERPQA